MGKRFAAEWLWLMGCIVAAAVWIYLTGGESDPFGIALGSILLGPAAYLAVGIIRVTVWAIRLSSKS